MDAQCSIRMIDEQKRVFPTLLSHFSWRRARSRISGGKLEQTLTLPTVQTVSLLLVWLLRKKDGEGTTPHSGRISFLEYGMKHFSDCDIFDGESFVHASFSLLQFSVCFATCFQGKKCVFECKSCKNVVFGDFECFSWYERMRSRFLSQKLQKWMESSSKPLGYLLHNVMFTRKAVGVLFGRILYEKTRFLVKLAKITIKCYWESVR